MKRITLRDVLDVYADGRFMYKEEVGKEYMKPGGFIGYGSIATRLVKLCFNSNMPPESVTVATDNPILVPFMDCGVRQIGIGTSDIVKPPNDGCDEMTNIEDFNIALEVWIEEGEYYPTVTGDYKS